MLPLNHKRTTSSLAPAIFYVTKNSAIKKIKSSSFDSKPQELIFDIMFYQDGSSMSF
jgi:hypothetical protein